MKLKIGDAGLLFASTIIVNAGNYLINLILGRILGPEKFAEASIIATGVLMLSFLAVGIQLTTAKFCTEALIKNESRQLNDFFWWFHKKTLMFVTGLCLILFLSSSYIQSFLNFKSIYPIWIICIGLPAYFIMSMKRGYVQGTDQFKKMALTYLMEMLLRLGATFLLLYFALSYFEHLTTEAVSMGFLLSFFAAIWVKPPHKMDSSSTYNSKPVIAFIGIIIFYEFSQILINNSDVILVKHFFSSAQAGLYAAIALIGRVVFFGTWTIVTLLFPKVIQREKQGLPHLKLFWQSFGITFGFGTCILVACILFPELIINILFGKEYLIVAPLLWKYAAATTLFACANVFAYYYMSLEKYGPVYLSVLAGILQVFLIWLFHEQLETVIYMQIIIMSCLLLSMIIYQLNDHFSFIGSLS